MRKRRHIIGTVLLVFLVCSIGLFTERPRAAPAGSVAAPGLRVRREANDQIQLTWPGSCLAGDTDFAVYEGTLDDPGVLEPVICTTGGSTTYSYAPLGDRVFLIVPRNATREGSYGTDSAEHERPPSTQACLPQEISVCPSSVPLADINSI